MLAFWGKMENGSNSNRSSPNPISARCWCVSVYNCTMCTYTFENGEASAHCSSYNQYADAFQALQIAFFIFNNNSDSNHASIPINLLALNFVYVFELDFPAFESTTQCSGFLIIKFTFGCGMLGIGFFPTTYRLFTMRYYNFWEKARQ